MRVKLFYGAMLASAASLFLTTQPAQALSLQNHHDDADFKMQTELMEMENNAMEESVDNQKKQETHMIHKA